MSHVIPETQGGTLMNARRITLTLGAAAGGLLAAAFMSTAVASAVGPADGDDVSIFNDLPSPSDNLPIIQATNGAPPYFQDVTGYQEFQVDDTTVGTSTTPVPVGDAYYTYSDWTTGSLNNQQWVFAEFSPNAAGEGITFANLPDVGSVYDTMTFGSSGLENVYDDVLSGSGSSETGTVTDLLYFDGTEIANLSSLVSAFAITPADFNF